MERSKRLLKIYIAVFIAAILIAVPVAVYLLPPQIVPIEVQNGFAEYNWTSDRFLIASYVGFEGSWVIFTDLAAIG